MEITSLYQPCFITRMLQASLKISWIQGCNNLKIIKVISNGHNIMTSTFKIPY